MNADFNLKLKEILQNCEKDELNIATEKTNMNKLSNAIKIIDIIINALDTDAISKIIKLSEQFNVNTLISYDIFNVVTYNSTVISNKKNKYKRMILIWANDINLIKINTTPSIKRNKKYDYSQYYPYQPYDRHPLYNSFFCEIKESQFVINTLSNEILSSKKNPTGLIIDAYMDDIAIQSNFSFLFHRMNINIRKQQMNTNILFNGETEMHETVLSHSDISIFSIRPLTGEPIESIIETEPDIKDFFEKSIN